MEVAASEQEASIPTRVRPLFCPNSQARVHVAPPEVFFKCLDHIVEPAFSIMARTEEKDPIRFQEAAGEIPAVSIPKYHIGLRHLPLRDPNVSAESTLGTHMASRSLT